MTHKGSNTHQTSTEDINNHFIVQLRRLLWARRGNIDQEPPRYLDDVEEIYTLDTDSKYHHSF